MLRAGFVLWLLSWLGPLPVQAAPPVTEGRDWTWLVEYQHDGSAATG